MSVRMGTNISVDSLSNCTALEVSFHAVNLSCGWVKNAMLQGPVLSPECWFLT